MQTVTSDIKGLSACAQHSKRRTRASAGVIQAEKTPFGAFFHGHPGIASRQEDGRFDWQG